MSLYVHRPAVTDPTVAPAGDDTFYALSPVPHLGHKNQVNWQAEKDRYRTKVAKVLETLIPGFQDHLSTELIFTPEDFRDRYLSPFGCQGPLPRWRGYTPRRRLARCCVECRSSGQTRA